jgi:hypothetical protein
MRLILHKSVDHICVFVVCGTGSGCVRSSRIGRVHGGGWLAALRFAEVCCRRKCSELESERGEEPFWKKSTETRSKGNPENAALFCFVLLVEDFDGLFVILFFG